MLPFMQAKPFVMAIQRNIQTWPFNSEWLAREGVWFGKIVVWRIVTTRKSLFWPTLSIFFLLPPPPTTTTTTTTTKIIIIMFIFKWPPKQHGKSYRIHPLQLQIIIKMVVQTTLYCGNTRFKTKTKLFNLRRVFPTRNWIVLTFISVDTGMSLWIILVTKAGSLASRRKYAMPIYFHNKQNNDTGVCKHLCTR